MGRVAASLLITFRETLEATLVVGIILAFLRKEGADHRFHRSVWAGVFAGVMASILLAWIFETFLFEWSEGHEELVEGALMFLAAGLLTWMIFWMSKQARIREEIERKVGYYHVREELLGLFFLALVSVLREGIETIIFLNAAVTAGNNGFFGGMLGISLALLLGFLFFTGLHRIKLKVFFRTTSILLILFAAGLIAHGIHEFQEAGLLPYLTHEAWNTNFIVNEASAIGSLLKGLFGYNGNPSHLEVFGYSTFLITSFFLFLSPTKRLSPLSSS
jgi:high-affinity iron transporter